MTTQPDTPAERREALTDQCAYLIDEAEALTWTLGNVPAGVLEARPLGKRSIKETLGYLHGMDAHVYLPRLRRMVEEDDPAFEDVDTDALVEAHDWNARDVDHLLDRLRASRAAIVDFLNALPDDDWRRTARFPDNEHRSIYDLALAIARHDRRHLSAIAYRLFEVGGRMSNV